MIKLRAWNKNLGCIFYVNNTFSLSISNTGNSVIMWCSDGAVDEFPADKIMQFTGIRDKNGRDIYEGDIVVTEQTDDIPGLDNWGRDAMGFAIAEVSQTSGVSFKEVKSNHSWSWDEDDTIYSSNYYIVVGNIYENGEIIKNENLL